MVAGDLSCISELVLGLLDTSTGRENLCAGVGKPQGHAAPHPAGVPVTSATWPSRAPMTFTPLEPVNKTGATTASTYSQVLKRVDLLLPSSRQNPAMNDGRHGEKKTHATEDDRNSPGHTAFDVPD